MLTPKTHCKHGHEFTEENTYRAPSRPDRRMCRECLRETHRRLRREHPERYGYVPAPRPEPRECVQCGNTFTPRRRSGERSRFCSKLCANASYRDRNRPPPRDEPNRSTLTAVDVRELIRLYEDEQLSMAALAAHFGVQKPQVSAIINGRSWQSVTGGVNRSRHANPVVPDRDYRGVLVKEVDALVTRCAMQLDISESEVRRHLRRIFHPKPEDRK